MKIERVKSDSETVFVLIGRISSPDVQQLKASMTNAGNRVALDLQEVRVVDLDAAHFLAQIERQGVELRRVPRYIREWIRLESPRVGG